MKVLLIRFSSIGDIVLTSPVARCLKLQTGATVHFLTKQAFQSLLASNPHIDQVHSFDKDIQQVIPKLKAEQFDYIIDLHNNLRSLRVKLALGRPSSSFRKLNLEKWLLVNIGVNFLPQKHIVDRYLDAASHLGIANDNAGLDHFIPEKAQVKLDTFGDNLSAGSYTAFAIGATHFTKRLPPAKMLEICQQLQRPMVLLGGNAVLESGNWLAEQLGSHVVNLCGKLSLQESASVINQAAVVLTHDTGMMHIAAAFKKPVVSVWGSTVPEFGMYPYYPSELNLNSTIEVKGLSCRPCSKIGHTSCPKKHFRCMEEIDAESVVEAVEQYY